MKLLPGRRFKYLLLMAGAVAAYLNQKRRTSDATQQSMPLATKPLATKPMATKPPSAYAEPPREEPQTPVLGVVAQPDVKPASAPPTRAAKPRPSSKPRPHPGPPADDTPTPPSGTPVVGPHGPGSAAPLADGAAPSADYTIKGNASSKLFHTPDSPYYKRTVAEVWFRSEDEATAAGFTKYVRKGRKS